MRRKLLAILAVVSIFVASAACTPQEATMHGKENTYRAEHGLRNLLWDGNLHTIAVAHAHSMADHGFLYHSDLNHSLARLPSNAYSLAENVGRIQPQYYSDPLEAKFRSMVASPSHRVNLLGAHYNKGAVAVIERDGYLWFVHLYAEFR